MSSILAEKMLEMACASMSQMLQQTEQGVNGTFALHQSVLELKKAYKRLLDDAGLLRPSYAIEVENLTSYAGQALNAALAKLAEGKSEAAARQAFAEVFSKAIQPRLF